MAEADGLRDRWRAAYGTGAAPWLPKSPGRCSARLMVGIVTKPFGFEGRVRRNQAEQGADLLPRRSTLSLLSRTTVCSRSSTRSDFCARCVPALPTIRFVRASRALLTWLAIPGLINLGLLTSAPS